MTPAILWALLAVVGVMGMVALAVGVKARAKAAKVAPERPRAIHHECALGGHNYLAYQTGYRCLTCGNHVSSREGEQYGKAEDGHRERRREPR